MSTPKAAKPPPGADARAAVPDHQIARRLWPVLLAAVVGLFPFTIYSTFLVPIAATVEAGDAAVGALRGLGGVAALAAGVALAPLLGRWSQRRTAVAALSLLAVTSLGGTTGTFPALIGFCLGIGVATAVLTPTLLASATAAYSDRADSGRAATLVTATQTLAAVMAGPVIGVMALWQGWQGALWITAALAAVAAALFWWREAAPPRQGRPPGYREAFSTVRARPDLLALIAIAALRTTSFMGYLSFLAVTFHDRFAMDAPTFTLVWTLSGAAFFSGNYLAGRWARRRSQTSAVPQRRLLALGLAGALAAVAVVFLTSSLVTALIATVVMGFSHAVVAALVTTLIAHRAGALMATTYSLNAAGMSLGVFTGAFLGGVGLGLAAAPGLTLALALPTAVAFFLIRPATAARSSDVS